MGKITKAEYNALKEKVELLEQYLNGGKGSGNFGHSGRPGKVGGSGSGKGGVSTGGKEGGSESDGKKEEKTVAGIKAMEKVETPKDFQNKAITGVDGNESYGTGLRKIPRMSNLTAEQARLENKICECYENPEKLEESMDKYVKMAEDLVKSGGKDRLTFETDAVKQVLPGWGDDSTLAKLDLDRKNPDKSDKERATAQREYDKIMETRQALNSVYHQTANAICKAAFEREAAKYADKGEGMNIVVTSGGCGAGKGFGQGMLAKGDANVFNGESSVVKDFSERYKNTAMVWDSAGDQCSSELYWLKSVAKNNNLKMVVLQTNNNNPDMYSAMAAQQIGRAKKEGRMVASKVSADSYVVGNKNVSNFYKNNKNDSNISFYTVGNVGRDYGYDGSGKVALKTSANEKSLKPLSISKGITTVAADGKKIISAINDAAGKMLADSPSEATQAANIVYGTHFYDNHKLKG